MQLQYTFLALKIEMLVLVTTTSIGHFATTLNLMSWLVTSDQSQLTTLNQLSSC